ncbi:DISARM system phospholipase D-like protein DrmC [Nocardia sp. alder85J]|uniref:DISARM system phospholipase D-like protein DrmC n=1 Tax=Nocardia sp. alder85J TaxID=2862949 RepID=UPI001CD410FE|nr:DISARM system phospholipase D-like protein DrmC [Nocardia sp. alder85J]MCX4092081.1 DISARM system phospholipase D-like protein DrmC [Nocardia sp. alder85J]
MNLETAAGRLGPSRLRKFADLITAGAEPVVIVQSFPGFVDEAHVVIDAMLSLGSGETSAFLRGFAGGLDHPQLRVESVWSGPSVHGVPVRATAHVLTELIERADKELLLATYSAKPHAQLRDTLAQAIRRNVRTVIVVETLQGAAGAISGDEPALAFDGIGAELWHWPPGARDKGAKMHAKLAVADRRELFVTSANLTQSGVGQNMEAGLLIRGGSAPQRAAEHLTALKAAGVLKRLL